MSRRIRVTQLSSRCITRSRGQNAGRKLQRYLEAGPVEIDLDGVEMLSMSFLDGLICHFIEHGNEELVTFRVSDPAVKNKLARLAAIRCVTLYYRSGDQQPRRRISMLSPSYDAEFAPGKTLLLTEVEATGL